MRQPLYRSMLAVDSRLSTCCISVRANTRSEMECPSFIPQLGPALVCHMSQSTMLPGSRRERRTRRRAGNIAERLRHFVSACGQPISKRAA